MSYPIHPAADLFPMMSEQEFSELVENMRQQSLREPVKLYDGMILDGRNRIKACELLTLEPQYQAVSTEMNPYDYVWSHNAERRHLPAGTKASIFEEYIEKSDAWGQAQARVREEANRHRAASAQQRLRTETGTFHPAAARQDSESENTLFFTTESKTSDDLSSGASNNAPLDTVEKSSTKPTTSKRSDPTRKISAKKGKAAGTSSATAERAKRLKENRPDLHRRVCKREMSLNAAMKQMKREMPKPAVTPTVVSPGTLGLYVACAEALPLADACVDIIITSPPYNIGPKGGKAEQRESGQSVNGGRAWVGIEEETRQPEAKYQGWQLDVLKELFRVAKPGASLFYNHKVRQQGGAMIHPMAWLLEVEGWTVRQEIIWNRGSTHNHERTYFWPHDERVYWLTKGKPRLPKEGIQEQSTVWSFHGPVSDTWHVSPFPEELPKRCLTAMGASGKVVLDPFGGSMTVCKVALEMGAAHAIGCDKKAAHIERACVEYGWTAVR